MKGNKMKKMKEILETMKDRQKKGKEPFTPELMKQAETIIRSMPKKQPKQNLLEAAVRNNQRVTSHHISIAEKEIKEREKAEEILSIKDVEEILRNVETDERHLTHKSPWG